jgi:hypothetical protein
MQTNLLQNLFWDEGSDWWRGRLDINSSLSIEVCISAEATEFAQVLERVGALCRIVREQELSYRESAADTLLSLHNDTWNEGAAISRAEFISRLELESLVVTSDRECGQETELLYDDDDLFWGHVILVSLNQDGHFADATIAG